MELKPLFKYLDDIVKGSPNVQRGREATSQMKRTSTLTKHTGSLHVNSGAPDRIRTYDSRFRKPKLYPLSYWSNVFIIAKKSFASTMRHCTA